MGSTIHRGDFLLQFVVVESDEVVETSSIELLLLGVVLPNTDCSAPLVALCLSIRRWITWF